MLFYFYYSCVRIYENSCWPTPPCKGAQEGFQLQGKKCIFWKGEGPFGQEDIFSELFSFGGSKRRQTPNICEFSHVTSLSNARLGPATLSISDDVSLHGELLKTFPSLSSADGYELLLYQRGGDDKGFNNITTPHTASKVKALANQAVVYIRPLQMDISAVAGSSTSSYNSEVNVFHFSHQN